MERIIITARYLRENFGHLDFYPQLMAPFAAPTDELALADFDAIIQGLVETPDEPGKQDSIEAMQHMKMAFEKMTPFERSAVRRDLAEEIFLFRTLMGKPPGLLQMQRTRDCAQMKIGKMYVRTIEFTCPWCNEFIPNPIDGSHSFDVADQDCPLRLECFACGKLSHVPAKAIKLFNPQSS